MLFRLIHREFLVSDEAPNLRLDRFKDLQLHRCSFHPLLFRRRHHLGIPLARQALDREHEHALLVNELLCLKAARPPGVDVGRQILFLKRIDHVPLPSSAAACDAACCAAIALSVSFCKCWVCTSTAPSCAVLNMSAAICPSVETCCA